MTLTRQPTSQQETFMRLAVRPFALTTIVLALTGCLNAKTEIPQAADHLKIDAPTQVEPAAAYPTGNIPAPVTVTASLPEPGQIKEESTHTVIVFQVPVNELLFSLARDSKLNLDIDPEINSTISLNAIEQPLSAILNRISETAGIRFEISNNVLRVQRDLPFLRSYAIDYLNISRSSIGSVAVSTEISSTGGGATGSSSSSSETGNSSDTVVRNVSENSFWQTLERNVAKIINRGNDSESGESSNPDIIVNSESGTLAVRATEREHEDIAKFLDRVQLSSQRQVLIEATIAEVNLSDTYQAGIDWNLISPDASSSVEIGQILTDVALSSPPTFNLSVSDLNIGGGNQLQATLRALETFGDVSVMSSPKVMAMNNQTALLKVVDNLIYFTVEVNIDTGSGVIGGSLTTFETEVNTVPVGFVMSVTPFIDENGGVTLNVRPTISRVISFVQDPNPALADANVISQIPVIQVREVESILRVDSGEIAVIGGLMQDEVKRNNRGVPMLSRLPGIGKAFQYDDNVTNKTELVIFLKPTVIERRAIANRFAENPSALSRELIQ
ncbi:MAG: MSHA type pilus biogenesis protein MshL [Candidatus Azotimanducaceae bacterium]|jgi:MSHA type pilus biogenesis protein MshL